KSGDTCSSSRFKFSDSNNCGVMSRLGTGRSSCFRIAGFKNGISDIMVPPDSHWIRTTPRVSWPIVHNWPGDCDHSFVYLDAYWLMTSALVLLPEWSEFRLMQINGGYAAYDNGL